MPNPNYLRMQVSDITNECNIRIALLDFHNASSIEERYMKILDIKYIPIGFEFVRQFDIDEGVAVLHARRIGSARKIMIDIGLAPLRSYLCTLRKLCSENTIHYYYEPLHQLFNEGWDEEPSNNGSGVPEESDTNYTVVIPEENSLLKNLLG